MAKKIRELDENSEWYRIDPWDNEPFMATHRRQKYRNAKTKNDYHNKKKYLQRRDNEWKPVEFPMFDLTEGGLIKDVIREQEKEVIPLEPILNEIINEPEIKACILNEKEIRTENNRKTKIVLATFLGDKNEVAVEWVLLAQLGADLKSYDSVEQLPHCSLKKANYGDFSVLWVSVNKVLITKQTNLLWTNTWK